jgi:hypothetical protein
MNEESPSTLTPKIGDVSALMAGTPLAIVGVLLYEQVFGVKLETYAATAVGAVFATVVGYLFYVGKVLIDRWIARELLK